MNPFLTCISGHSVVPHSELLRLGSRIQFITQVREPVARAVSQYKFWVGRMKIDVEPEAFLDHHTAANFQVKKIAGCEDLELAKKAIAEKYLLAGTVEQFDEFLVLLAGRLQMPAELFDYRKKNEARPNASFEVPAGFREELSRRNALDAELYHWIKTELYDRYVSLYGDEFQNNLYNFKMLHGQTTTQGLASGIDFVYRNAYWKPLSGMIRTFRGLPYSGSYGSS